VAACDRAPSAEALKDWSPADHDQEPGRAPAANQGARTASAGGTPALVEVTWRNQCISCHGPGGKGDGPQGAMFKAADLSRAEWQSSVKDEDIAAVIKNGKGRMPKFDLPPDVVQGLVARIRAFGPEQKRVALPAPSAVNEDTLDAVVKEAMGDVKSMVARSIVKDPAHPDEGDVEMKCGVIPRSRARMEAKDPSLKKAFEETARLCAFDVPLMVAGEDLKQAAAARDDTARTASCNFASEELERARSVHADDPRVRELDARLKSTCKR
jgi:mono/diheme cytochrome c family protein